MLTPLNGPIHEERRSPITEKRAIVAYGLHQTYIYNVKQRAVPEQCLDKHFLIRYN